jgi:hypothetical protein
MHYPQYVFAINKTYPTITPLIGRPALGQRTGFSLVCKKKNYFMIAKMLNLTHYNIFKWIFTYCSWTSKNWKHCIAPHRNKCFWRAHENNLHRSVSHTNIVAPSFAVWMVIWWPISSTAEKTAFKSITWYESFICCSGDWLSHIQFQ